MMDLHLHSTCSDGECDVRELLQIAQTKGLKYIAISDHNTMDAWDILEKDEVCCCFDGAIIPACELAFTYHGICMDMLGYGVDRTILEASGLLKHHDVEQELIKQQHALCRMIEVSRKLGFVVNDCEIKHAYERANDVICDALMAKSENAELLKEYGIDGRASFYRKAYLNPNSPFYMPIEQEDVPDLQTCADAIHQANGMCFLAHLFVYDVEDHKALLTSLMQTGCFDGIEVVHRHHTKAQSAYLREYCKHHQYVMSGGSDFHLRKHDMGYGDDGKIAIDERLAPWLDDQLKR